MIVAVHQPNWLPWLGWFAKARQADLLVLLDDVQYEKAGPTARVRIKSPAGTPLLSVPLRKGPSTRRIDELLTAEHRDWRRAHARVLANAYAGCPGWPRLGPEIAEILAAGEDRLSRLNETLIRRLAAALGVSTPMVRASDLGPRDERGNLGNLELCRRVGATCYLSGAGARAYNDPAPFDAAGIELRYSRFEHPVHAQPHGPFVAGLSAVDLCFSEPDRAAEILASACG